MFLTMPAPGVGPYLNARLKNCAFPGADENNKSGYMYTRSDAWKRAKVCSIQRRNP